MTYANLRPTACAVFLLIGVSSATALTLERFRGSVTLGRPLDFNVQATLSSNEDASSLCLEAEVIQSETSINPARVNVQLLKPDRSGLSAVRVTSPIIVEEPLLTVVIKYGCLSKNFRRYVVFADPPIKLNEKVQSIDSDPGFISESSEPTSLIATTPRAATGRQAAITIPSRLQATATTPSNLSRARRLAASEAIKNTKPRLQLDSIESSSELITRLKPTLELSVAPSELPSEQRARAAALWQIIGAKPDDLVLDVQRLTALQKEATALREVSTQGRVEISRLSAQLKEAESSKYQNPFVYGLFAVLALLLGGLSFLWFRSKSHSTNFVWWKLQREASESEDKQKSIEAKDKFSAKSTTQQREPVVSLKVKQVNRLVDRKEPEATPAQPKFKSSESAYAMLGAQSNARGVNVEELFDIQQQADFFTSLGQHDQAIEVLRNHIDENAHTSPLFYLDLLKLYHLQNKRDEYQELTSEFTRLFNVDVPIFDSFQEQTRGIEAYQATLSQIVSSWNTEAVLKVIEDSIFRKVEGSSETLDLEAYRELLLLHSVAKDLSENQKLVSTDNQTIWPNIDLPPTIINDKSTFENTNQTSSQKLILNIKFDDLSAEESSFRPGVYQKPVGTRIGLDIDLTATEIDVLQKKSEGSRQELKKETSAESKKSGLIEFDLDSFAKNDIKHAGS